MITKSYSRVVRLNSFEERFEYLKLKGSVGEETFGFDRYLNQMLYRCGEWKLTRDKIIVRDNGCDLGVPGFEIYGKILVHHINPITLDDIKLRRDCVFDPDNLICTSQLTHNAIHYGDEKQLIRTPIERRMNDTCPWRQ